MSPAVKRALKAADKLAHEAVIHFASVHENKLIDMYKCQYCRWMVENSRRKLRHDPSCRLIRYLAARKEIADEV